MKPLIPPAVSYGVARFAAPLQKMNDDLLYYTAFHWQASADFIALHHDGIVVIVTGPGGIELRV